MKTFSIEMSKTSVINTDPQRRCYNGCHAKSEMVSLPWEVLQSGVKVDKVEDKLKFWRELNDYAVSQRGSSAKAEFRAVEEASV
jgi:hypothetical protein